jgi:hypothetical protein
MKAWKSWPGLNPVTLFLLIVPLFGIFSCGGSETTAPGLKPNSAPVITSVRILPENPNRETELHFNIEGRDPDGDPMTYRFQWVRNESNLPDENRNTLNCRDLSKGDSVQVRVTPTDGKTEGEPFLAPPVRILNSPPLVSGVDVEPKQAYASDTLKAKVKSSDLDGDFIYHVFQWEKNGIVLTEERTEVLERGQFKKGDSISVTVTPDDREVLGKPRKSDPIVISNSPPMIVSSPPVSVAEGLYTYEVKANDPDQDPILFSLKKGPKGMTIDPKTGLIRWKIHKESRGTHAIEIEACDNEEAKSYQRYTLTVDFR